MSGRRRAGSALRISAYPDTSVSRLLKSWASRLATWPRVSIVWAWRTSARSWRVSVTSSISVSTPGAAPPAAGSAVAVTVQCRRRFPTGTSSSSRPPASPLVRTSSHRAANSDWTAAGNVGTPTPSASSGQASRRLAGPFHHRTTPATSTSTRPTGAVSTRRLSRASLDSIVRLSWVAPSAVAASWASRVRISRSSSLNPAASSRWTATTPTAWSRRSRTGATSQSPWIHAAPGRARSSSTLASQGPVVASPARSTRARSAAPGDSQVTTEATATKTSRALSATAARISRSSRSDVIVIDAEMIWCSWLARRWERRTSSCATR